MAHLRAEHVARVIDYLRHERTGEDVSLKDVMHLAEVMAEGFQSVFEQVDTTIYRELGDMAREIAVMKAELSDLRLAGMRHDRIPEAGRELDAIVEATEEATNTIMTAAEAIMGADPSDADAYQSTVNDRIVEIFEACSFQDITGQRISKVVSTLTVLDARISTLVERLKLLEVEDSPTPAVESEADRRKRELILHGPQFKGEGVSQDDIDALLR
jgi:chemotaxis protein CheZ